jgi:prepilin-type N-terminal cleavage/methylation domain-containing protein
MRISQSHRNSAFTLVELLVVIGIMGMLMSMVLGVQRYAQSKSNRSRVEGQIAAFTAAAEAYKTDNAVYPRSAETDDLSSITSGMGAADASAYKPANLAFYTMLSGDADLNGRPDASEATGAGANATAPVSYYNFAPSLLQIDSGKVVFIRDPWGKPYGYSTKRQKVLQSGLQDDASAGHNITYDLWSTANSDANERAWIANW